MDQQFSLSWKNFHGNLSNGFAGLLGSREFVDVTLAVDGELLQAHKVVLSICSPYFKKMFQLNPCQHPIVVLRDITHRAMKDLIQFMYNGEVSVRQEDLASFINTAETLEIKGLTNRHSDTESIDDNRKLPSPASTASLPQHRPEVIIEDNHDKFDEAQLELTRSQIESINRLNRLVALKRKSEEFLANNYNVNPAKDIEQVCQPEKRTKLREKLILNSHKITNNCPPIGGISVRKFNRQFRNDAIQLSPVNMFNISSRQSSITDNEVERRNSYCEVNNTSIAREETVRNAADLMDDIKTEAADAENDCAFDDSPNRNISSDCANDLSLDEPLTVLPSPQHIPTGLYLERKTGSDSFPARYQYIYSRKGHKQLVYMNFVHTKHSTSHGKTSWRCVQYFSLNRCPATVETVGPTIYSVNHSHNHEDYLDKIVRNSVYEMDDTND